MNWKLATVFLAIMFLVVAVRAQAPDPSSGKDHPVLEVDLRKFGYDTSKASRHLPKFVDFIDSGHLAIAWLTLDDAAPAAGPAHLHALVLDASTGQKLGVQAWPTPSKAVRFLVARDGKFLTCTGNILRLFSSSLELVREQNLADRQGCRSPREYGWGISPSRRSLLFDRFLGPGQGWEYTLLDAETFSVIANWTEKQFILRISDHWRFAYCRPEARACIRRIDEPWQTFNPSVADNRTDDWLHSARFVDDWLHSARFVNDETLVMGRKRMWVITIGGTPLFQVELPKDRSFGNAVASSGGQRFAVLENRKRGSEALDMYSYSNDRAVVYSIPDRRAIYSVKVKGDSPWLPWKEHFNQLALSPDGTLLAVITDATLRVYRLPDDGPGY